jgi:hypothetical protein
MFYCTVLKSVIDCFLNVWKQEDYPEIGRPRAVTVSEGTHLGGGSDRDSHRDNNGSVNLPTVFKWDGGGKTAFICGTFSEWKTMPMVKRLVQIMRHIK